jgi:hypothetical protein
MGKVIDRLVIKVSTVLLKKRWGILVSITHDADYITHRKQELELFLNERS